MFWGRGEPVTQGWWQRQFFRWLDRRVTLAVEHRLHRKNLYILPTATGFAYCLLTLLIWLLGTNYQNNLILGLAYWQMGLLVVVILATYHNLAGLKIRFVGSRPGFVGEPLEFLLAVNTTNSNGCDRLLLSWQDHIPELIDVPSGSTESLTLRARPQRRGIFRPGRLLLESTYPMGIVRCWSWLPLDAPALVYPAPKACPFPSEGAGGDTEQGQRGVPGDDEFAGLRSYAHGHSPKRIAWKHYAREQGLFSKTYTQVASEQVWLEFERFHQGDLELTLSHICYWVLLLHRTQRPFGLRLPGQEIPMGSGEHHQLSVLESLATFGEIQ